MEKINVGDLIVVTKMHSGLAEDMVLRVTMNGTSGYWQAVVTDIPKGITNVQMGQAVNFFEHSVAPATRGKRAEIMEKSAAALRAEAATRTTEAAKLSGEAKRLRSFESDEEELADLLISIQDSKGSRGERVTKLAEALKGRIKTSQL